MRTSSQIAGMLALAVVACLIVACNDDNGGGGGSTGNGFTVDELQIDGTTTTAATVTINGLADDDATADTAWSKTFTLDGSDLDEDPGSDGGTASYLIEVDSDDGSGGTDNQSLVITVNP